jgi:hypothetical protein
VGSSTFSKRGPKRNSSPPHLLKNVPASVVHFSGIYIYHGSRTLVRKLPLARMLRAKRESRSRAVRAHWPFFASKSDFPNFGPAGRTRKSYEFLPSRRSRAESCHNGSPAASGWHRVVSLAILYRFRRSNWMQQVIENMLLSRIATP